MLESLRVKIGLKKVEDRQLQQRTISNWKITFNPNEQINIEFHVDSFIFQIMIVDTEFLCR